MTTAGTFHGLLRHRLLWPVVVLLLLVAGNLVFTPSFLSIEVRDGHLYGSVIDILRAATPLALVALGMTLVIATGGIDLSVGSVVAIAGAVACSWISGLGDQNAAGGVLAAMGLALGVALLLGAGNGLLVAVVGIQPIVATLILMVAGRGVAQLITNGQIITVNSAPYKTVGAGYWLAVPVSVLLTAAVVVGTLLLTRRTALALLIESVGGNPAASRLAGVNARRLTILVYVFAGLCAGLAGLIFSSNVSSADGNNAGNLIELDAILAVVIGGTSLAGGRFSIVGSVVGALVIKTLDITIYTIGVPTNTTLLFKAVVVVVLCLAQSPAFRARLLGRRGRGRAPSGTDPGAPGTEPPEPGPTGPGAGPGAGTRRTEVTA
ncbi:ABC transporter permease [Micromonospora sp. NPDC049559]|uniref:ABC transporter permease n=1 Tax=Micromonospora sp. NPDC049559 TaxID=3155923 RepID=UPI00344A152A